MVDKAAKRITLVVYHDELNSYELLTEVLINIMGWEHSQAENGANIIFNRGCYPVRTFKISEMNKAKAFEEAFSDNDIPVKLLIS